LTRRSQQPNVPEATERAFGFPIPPSSWTPARRAASVQPMEALRQE
jgi:hypothetical protein